MKKQVLSISDFVLILSMVNERVDWYERIDEPFDARILTKSELKREQERLNKKREQRLNSSTYLQLKHLQQSLQNLNIEVETANIEIQGE